jgi:hypothetical protein
VENRGENPCKLTCNHNFIHQAKALSAEEPVSYVLMRQTHDKLAFRVFEILQSKLGMGISKSLIVNF